MTYARSFCKILGKTGISLFPMGFGCWAIGGGHEGNGYGSTNDNESVAAIKKAIELGCRFFDTADWYGHGHSELLLGETLQSEREQVCITTKAGIDFYTDSTCMNFSPEYLKFAFQQSLSRLKTDYVDIFLLHNPPIEVVYSPEVVRTVFDFKAEGKANFIGVSAASPAEAMYMLDSGWLDVIQVPYNLLSQEASWLVFDKASALNVGIIVREILANGMLSEKIRQIPHFPSNDIRSKWDHSVFMQINQNVKALKKFCRSGENISSLAIRFALEHPQIGMVLIGCKNVNQVTENFEFAQSLLE